MVKSIDIVDKQHFLENSDNGYCFFECVLDGLKQRDSNTCENTYNPFYEDENPSFSVYRKDGMWRFKDHGDENYIGDVFTFAGLYYNLEIKKCFRQVLHLMYEELGIEKLVKTIDVDDSWFEIGFKLPGEQFSDLVGIEKAHEYFKSYGITKEILRRYHVRRIESYMYIDKNGEAKSWRYKEDEIAIAYEEVNHVKIYQPGETKYKFLHRGVRVPGYVFGQAQILRNMIKTKKWKRELLILTGGEKDVLTLASLGYDAITLNSETGNVPKQLEDSILNCYKHIVVMYDLDSTGKRNAEKLQKMHGFRICTLPDELKKVGGKDVADYVRLGLNIDVLRELVEESRMKIPSVFLNGKVSQRLQVATGYVTSNGVNLPFCNKTESIVDEICENGIELITERPVNNISEEFTNSTIEISIPSNHYEQSPFFPDDVFDNLPELLGSVCSQFTDKRERDMILLSSLTVLSTLMPKVRSINNSKDIGTNFNVMITAPPASGKGVNNWARELASEIKRHLKEIYKNECEIYSEQLKAFKNGDIEQEPSKPIRKSIFIPANNSVSNVYKMLEANENFGLIFETEGDTLTESLKSEWGHFSDVIRKCFHHETISLARKTADELIEVDKPHLSIFLTGTPEQVNGLIKSVENGFFSRFAFYNFIAINEWKSHFSNRDNSRELFFAEVSKQMYEYWLVLEDSDKMYVEFTDHQISIIDAYFARMQEEMYDYFGEDIIASVNRSCLIWHRLAMILTALRILEQTENLPASVTVDNKDAQTALLVINVLLTHLKSIFDRISSVTVSNLLNAQQQHLWNALPDQFTRNEFNVVVQRCNIMDKTGEKYNNDFIKKGLLKRIKHGEYCKIR